MGKVGQTPRTFFNIRRGNRKRMRGGAHERVETRWAPPCQSSQLQKKKKRLKCRRVGERGKGRKAFNTHTRRETDFLSDGLGEPKSTDERPGRYSIKGSGGGGVRGGSGGKEGERARQKSVQRTIPASLIFSLGGVPKRAMTT